MAWSSLAKPVAEVIVAELARVSMSKSDLAKVENAIKDFPLDYKKSVCICDSASGLAARDFEEYLKVRI